MAEAGVARERWWRRLVLIPLLVGAVLVGVFAPLASLHHGAAALLLPVVFGGLVLFVGVMLAVVWLARRKGALDRSPLMDVPDADRAQVQRALQRGEPVAARYRESALAAARQLAGRRWLAWTYAVIATGLVVSAVLDDDFGRWVAALMAASSISLSIMLFRWTGGARAFVRDFTDAPD